TDRYALCACGASMGDNYGPMIVARSPLDRQSLSQAVIAVPGTLTTAFLTLSLYMGGRGAPVGDTSIPSPAFRYEVHPFDEILNLVAAGRVDAGLIIHEGQLTYANQGLQLIVDLGQWWMQETGLPLPLGGNAIRRDLGANGMREV